MTAAVSELLAETDLSPAQMRNRILGDNGLAGTRSIYQRAHERAEIDLERIPAAVLTLPFDLVGHDLLLELRQ